MHKMSRASPFGARVPSGNLSIGIGSMLGTRPAGALLDTMPDFGLAFFETADNGFDDT